MTYPMGNHSIRYQLDHLDSKSQVSELFSNCVVIGGGVTLLFGPEKQGKTYLLLQMALCALCGEHFITLSTKQGKVLYVTFEGGKPYLIERIEDMAKTLFPDRIDELLGSIGVEDLKGSQLDRSVADIENLVAMYKPRYLICDPIDLALSGDYSTPTTVNKCMQNLITLAEDHKMGVIISSHSRKNTAGDFNDVIGSKMWLALSATIIRMTTDSGGTHLQFELRYGPPLRDIDLRFNPSGYFELARQPILREGERAKEAIVNALRNAGGNMRLKELRQKVAEEAGVHPNTVDSARHKLEQEEVIVCGRIRGSAAKAVALLGTSE